MPRSAHRYLFTGKTKLPRFCLCNLKVLTIKCCGNKALFLERLLSIFSRSGEKHTSKVWIFILTLRNLCAFWLLHLFLCAPTSNESIMWRMIEELYMMITHLKATCSPITTANWINLVKFDYFPSKTELQNNRPWHYKTSFLRVSLNTQIHTS